MDHRHHGSVHTFEQLAPVQMPVRDGEEDESEERVEGGSKEGQEIAHARDDLSEDEGKTPDTSHDTNPGAPSNDGVAVRVSGRAHDSEVDELGSDIGVDNTNDQCRHNDEGEGAFFVGIGAETAESWSGRILPEVVEADGWRADEQEAGHGEEDSEGLWKVLWLLHFRDECWEQDLRDPEERDIEDSIHAVDPSSAGERKRVSPDSSSGGIVAIVTVERVLLNAREDEEEKNGKCHAECCRIDQRPGLDKVGGRTYQKTST